MKNEIDWIDISVEEHRSYVYLREGTLVKYTISHPKGLVIRPSGSHQVIDGMGETHYLPTGYVSIVYKGDTIF